MRRIIILVLFAFALSACNGVNPSSRDNYYVKYDAEISTKYFGDITSIDVKGPDGTESYVGPKRTYSVTFGPVKKGFQASITATCRATGSAACTISVSKNNEPFAQKAHKTGTPSASASFVVGQ